MGCHIGALAGMFLPARVLRRGARGFLICVGPFVFCTENSSLFAGECHTAVKVHDLE